MGDDRTKDAFSVDLSLRGERRISARRRRK
jgi:hypothetical protein